jgi:threonine dehydrogenase-like Zn-dependent dehydrogenase
VEPLDQLGPEAALLGGAASTAYAMFARVGVAPGEPVVVLGGGAVARFLVDIAAAKGARPVLLCEPDAELSERAAQRGARSVEIPYEPSDGAEAKQVRDSVRSAAADLGCGERPWRVFETTAANGSRALAAALAGPASTLALLSARASSCIEPRVWHLDAEQVSERGCSVVGVSGAHPDLLPEVAALAARGDIDARAAATLIETEDLPRAIADLRREREASTVAVVAPTPR